jgi:hypothetical protein
MGRRLMSLDAHATARALAGNALAPATTDVSTHVTPETGIQTYSEAYPPYPATLGPFLPGGRAVEVVDVRGTWAHVFADGEEQGWVEGAQLHPPVGVAVPPATTLPPASAVASDSRSSISPGQIVGTVGALGMIIGALVTWTQVVSINAFKFPVQFLFDNKTQSHNPRLGWFISRAWRGALAHARRHPRRVDRRCVPDPGRERALRYVDRAVRRARRVLGRRRRRSVDHRNCRARARHQPRVRLARSQRG